MKIIERFDIYMEHKRLNDNKVTVQLGLSNGVIGKSRKEGRDLSDRVIEQILNFYTDLSREWLLYGEGDMLSPTGNTQVIEHNTGTAINGDGTVVHPAGDSRTIERMQNQIDELLAQNGKLLVIIDRLTQNK